MADQGAEKNGLRSILIVIPVPDQVRDDRSGIQFLSRYLEFWMPVQVRHDEKHPDPSYD
jgi:hypothetical protein